MQSNEDRLAEENRKYTMTGYDKETFTRALKKGIYMELHHRKLLSDAQLKLLMNGGGADAEK